MSRQTRDEGLEMVERRIDRLLDAADPRRTEDEAFFGAQFDAGLAIVHYPVGLGGLGLPAALQHVVDARLRAAGAKSATVRNPIGIGMGLPTLLAHGTDDQMRRYFRPCFATEELWCQLFSEPGSGSDLAGLGTRAVRDGDDWIVTGQKVWTSLAHRAHVGLLLARTHPDRPKHKGLTFFLVDMQAPGVEVRPLRQMTGDAEFNEVFLTDVRVRDDQRVGPAGHGWRVATTTLMNERVVIANAGSGRTGLGGSGVEKLLAIARAGSVEPQLRDELVRRFVDGQVVRWTNIRARAARGVGAPGPEGSITKLSFGLYNRQLQETALRVNGPSSMAWEPGDNQSAEVVRGFLRAQANTIEGGTANVLRNIIGEKVLGLPREPGPPSGTPWSQLPRNGIALLGQEDRDVRA